MVDEVRMDIANLLVVGRIKRRFSDNCAIEMSALLLQKT
jgi:hypothetical protein